MSESAVRSVGVQVERTRVVWVDVAKAMAIGLVVLHHVVVFADAAGWLPPSVVRLNTQLGTFRMPLFFLASGLFAAGALRKPWRSVLRRRIVLFVYLYLLWTLIRFGLFQVIPDVRTDGRDGDLGALLWSPLLPGTGLWFIYALALYSAVAKLTLRVPLALQFAAAAGASAVVGAGVVDLGNFAWRNMAMYYVFFLLGMYGRSPVERFAARADVPKTLALGAGAVVGVLLVERLALRPVPLVWLALSCVTVAFGVALAAQLSRVPAMATSLSWVGERTLPIYLMHVPLVALSVAALDSVWDPHGATGAALVLMLSVLAAGVSLAVYPLLFRFAPWLYQLPRRSA